MILYDGLFIKNVSSVCIKIIDFEGLQHVNIFPFVSTIDERQLKIIFVRGYFSSNGKLKVLSRGGENDIFILTVGSGTV